MRKTISRVLLATALCAALSAAYGQERIFPFDYTKVELENGFKAYLIKAGAPGQIAYVTLVRTGSRDEVEPGRSGFAHFFEHMMFRGTKKYPSFDDEITRIGADSNAFTSDDQTVYHIVASSDSLELLIDLESDRFMNLDYSEASFRTEAGAVLGEFNQIRANPFFFLFEKLRETAFERHTYKHTTIGFEADIRAMPEGFEYSRSFFRRFYRPENCVLLLAGDFDAARAEELIRKHYGDWQRGYQAPDVRPEPEQKSPRQAQARFPGQTLPILSVNYKGPAWSASDRGALSAEVLGQLAFGQNSDIYRKLVIREQKLQVLEADFGLTRDPGLLSITAMTIDAADLDYVASEIAGTAEKFRSQPCDAKRLEDTKSAIKYGFLLGMETARDAAFSLIGTVTSTGGLEAVEDYFRTLQSITPEDIQAAAKRFLVDEGRTTVTLLPAQGGGE